MAKKAQKADDIQVDIVTLNQDEVRKFDNNKEDWWSASGPLKPLMDLNPVRLQFIYDQVLRFYPKINTSSKTPYEGLSFLDIGCGAGYVCEPLARLGGTVNGIDASENAITQARQHAVEQNLDINYQRMTVEQKAAENIQYDVILALEVVEHVDNVDTFLKACTHLLKPNGILFLSTMNRTFTSYIKAIMIAEYLLKWVPKGTHDWNKFLKPSELAAPLQEEGCYFSTIKGIDYNPFSKEWVLSQKIDTNYIACAIKR